LEEIQEILSAIVIVREILWNKMKELFELKLGNMIMDAYEGKLLEILRCVSFIRNEKVKIHRFMSGLPLFYKDKIQFDEPKNVEEAIRKAKYLYEHNRGRPNSKGFGMTRRKTRWIKGRNDSSHHS
jgi:hypothetical protein